MPSLYNRIARQSLERLAALSDAPSELAVAVVRRVVIAQALYASCL